ncbi:hypothetical protein PV963_06075 [Streptomyces coeruleorubidus]|nr:hypothetical protein [Streptomyces coeruleorubidus]WDV49961.1 hypothetical protein PV963_06075 [Streptomyces coeruleorubidus]
MESSTPAAAGRAYAGRSEPSLRCITSAAAGVTAEETARPTISGATRLSDGA